MQSRPPPPASPSFAAFSAPIPATAAASPIDAPASSSTVPASPSLWQRVRELLRAAAAGETQTVHHHALLLSALNSTQLSDSQRCSVIGALASDLQRSDTPGAQIDAALEALLLAAAPSIHTEPRRASFSLLASFARVSSRRELRAKLVRLVLHVLTQWADEPDPAETAAAECWAACIEGDTLGSIETLLLLVSSCAPSLASVSSATATPYTDVLNVASDRNAHARRVDFFATNLAVTMGRLGEDQASENVLNKLQQLLSKDHSSFPLTAIQLESLLGSLLRLRECIKSLHRSHPSLLVSTPPSSASHSSDPFLAGLDLILWRRGGLESGVEFDPECNEEVERFVVCINVARIHSPSSVAAFVKHYQTRMDGKVNEIEAGCRAKLFAAIDSTIDQSSEATRSRSLFTHGRDCFVSSASALSPSSTTHTSSLLSQINGLRSAVANKLASAQAQRVEFGSHPTFKRIGSTPGQGRHARGVSADAASPPHMRGRSLFASKLSTMLSNSEPLGSASIASTAPSASSGSGTCSAACASIHSELTQSLSAARSTAFFSSSDSLKVERDQLRMELLAAQSVVTNVQTQHTREVDALRAEMDAQRTVQDAAVRELEQLRARIDVQRKEQDAAIQEQRTQHESAITALRASHSKELQALRAEMEQSRKASQAQILQQTAQALELQKQFAASQIQVASLTASLAAAQEQLRSTVAAQASFADILAEEHASALAESDALRSSIHSSEIQVLQLEREQLKQALAEIQQQLDTERAAALAARQAAESAKEFATLAAAESAATLHASRTETSQWQQAASDAQAEVVQLRAFLSTVQAEVDSLRSELATATLALQSAQTESVSLRSRCTEADASILHLRTSYSQLQSDSAASSAASSAELASLRIHLQTAQESIHSLEVELHRNALLAHATGSGSANEMQGEILAMHAEMSDTKAELKEVREELMTARRASMGREGAESVQLMTIELDASLMPMESRARSPTAVKYSPPSPLAASSSAPLSPSASVSHATISALRAQVSSLQTALSLVHPKTGGLFKQLHESQERVAELEALVEGRNDGGGFVASVVSTSSASQVEISMLRKQLLDSSARASKEIAELRSEASLASQKYFSLAESHASEQAAELANFEAVLERQQGDLDAQVEAMNLAHRAELDRMNEENHQRLRSQISLLASLQIELQESQAREASAQSKLAEIKQSIQASNARSPAPGEEEEEEEHRRIMEQWKQQEAQGSEHGVPPPLLHSTLR